MTGYKKYKKTGRECLQTNQQIFLGSFLDMMEG